MKNRWRDSTSAGAAVAAVAGVVCTVAGVVGAVRSMWISDDAYISFRYAQHLVDGLGLVFNEGERVEGYTNFLWTMWSALAIRFGVEPRVWALWWGVALFAASIALLALNHFHLRKALAISTASLPVAAAVTAFHGESLVYATGGLETSCFTFLVLLGFFLLAGRTGGCRSASAGIILALAALARPDGILFAAVAGLFTLWDARSSGRSWFREGTRFTLSFACLWVPFTIWRVWYYGDFFPNTYYAKSAYRFWIEQGWTYVRLFYTEYWILLAALPLAWLAVSRTGGGVRSSGRAAMRRQTVLASGFVLVYTAFVIKVGGDFMYGRFLVPTLPFLAVLLDVGLIRLAIRRPWPQLVASVALISALVTGPRPVNGKTIVHGIADEPSHYDAEYIDQVTRGAKVIRRYLAGLDVGVAFTGSEARLMYEGRVPRALECETGLTDRTIARQTPTERGRIGHEKHADLEYVVLERKAHLAFKPYTLDIIGARGRLPVRTVLLDEGVRGFLLHWDPALMRELKRRGASFKDFPADLDRLIAGLDRLPRDDVEELYEGLRLFYFDHVDDARRRAAFEARLRSDR